MLYNTTNNIYLSIAMLFSSQLYPAILIKRYKRFLADVELPNGKIATIHCANTGAMTGCAEPGDTIWYSISTNKNRKLPFSWELTYTKNFEWIVVNTTRANTIVKEAINNKQIADLSHYTEIQSEVKYGDENSRIDLLLKNGIDKECYIEVKSVTLCTNNTRWGYFPDTVTLRGQKHLRELMLMVAQGKRAIIFFLIQHTGIDVFSPAVSIDPLYCQLLKQARQQGVEVLCYNTVISLKSISLDQPIPFLE